MPSSENQLVRPAVATAPVVAAEADDVHDRKARVLNLLSQGQSIAGLLIVCIIFTALSADFLTQYNLFNILRQSAVTAILAAGMVFVIVTGGIDLSVGAVVAVSGTLTAGMLRDGLPIPAAIAIGLLVGLGFGLVNGVLVAVARMPAFIVTLGTMTVGSSVALAYSQGLPISNLPDGFTYLGQGAVGPIPVPVILAAVVALIAGIVLKRTLIGRYAVAIGGGEQVAFLSGVNTARWKATVYAVMGLLAGFAGIVLAARQNSGQPTAGAGVELMVIAAVVIGGTSLSGGRGSMWGAMIGTLLITVINNGLNLLNVSPYYQGLLVGGLILAAVALDRRNRR
ncbi:MAG: ABC transporter permease [Actinomycetota bacterium]|nr:ABC transporter permease [Actinomycetota bacterium]